MGISAIRYRDEPTNGYIILKVVTSEKSYEVTASKRISLLENMEKKSVPIKNSCRRGLCGSCRVKLVKGEVLELSERFDGYILSCSTYPRGHVEIIIPD